MSGRAVDDGLITNVILTRTFPLWAPSIATNVTLEGNLPGKKTWTNVLSLVDGTNTFVATATDFSGKTGVSFPRTIFLRTVSPLAVNVHGGGGTIAVGTSFGAATSGALLEVNRGYFIRAIPNSGIHFVNWSDRNGHIIGNNSLLNFVMTNDLILNANFDR